MSTDEQQADEVTTEEFRLAARGQLVESPRSDIAILLSQAIQIPDFDVKKFNELMTMMREHDEVERKQRAQEAYLAAKSEFLGSCPVITADKRADKFNYPSYGKILEISLPLMANVGLSHTTTPDFDAEIVTCTMKHTLGHEESATFPMTLEGQPPTGNFKLSLQQKWAIALTFAERQSFKAVSGVPTSDSDVDMLPLAVAGSGSKEQADPIARTATVVEYEALKAGWWKFARPPEEAAVQPGEGSEYLGSIPESADQREQPPSPREEFDKLQPHELAELFYAWVCRSVGGVTLDFVHLNEPHTTFTLRQITDLWAIINNKEGKGDVSSEPESK